MVLKLKYIMKNIHRQNQFLKIKIPFKLDQTDKIS